jgi:hypothetical protein
MAVVNLAATVAAPVAVVDEKQGARRCLGGGVFRWGRKMAKNGSVAADTF